MDVTTTPVLRRGKKDRTVITCAAMGSILTMMLICALALLCTVIAYRNNNPSEWITPFAYLSALISALMGGFSAARLRGRQGLLCGLLTGVSVLMLFAVGLLIFTGESELQAGRILIFYALIYALCVLGGILGGLRREKHHRRRKR